MLIIKIKIVIEIWNIIFNFLINQKKYKKKLLWLDSYILKKKNEFFLEKSCNEQSELKYLSNFRKKNQTRLLINKVY